MDVKVNRNQVIYINENNVYVFVLGFSEEATK